MEKAKLFLSAAAILVLTAFTASKNIWNIDNAHSEIGFSITHMGISDISGTFDDFSATITRDKEDFSDATVTATINVGSINTRIDARDGHLKTADFFDAEKYPQITFKSTKIENAGKGKYKLTGEMTAKGITKPVVFEMTHRGTIENPQTKKMVAGFKISGVIKRSDFGIGSGFPAPVLSDEANLTVNGQFHQQ